jgi:glyoxylase-like metal-dependent hydrolase (beta-lactamase superfamily II)
LGTPFFTDSTIFSLRSSEYPLMLPRYPAHHHRNLLSDHTVVVDTGFSAEVAARRGREHLRRPAEGLEALGIDCARVPLVVLTHLHYDHIGNLEDFPAATFVVQEEEMAFWTGRYAGREQFRTLVETNDVLYLVGENVRGKLRFVAGNQEIVPGIEVYRVGGHSAGLQVVRAKTGGGSVVLASDATHFYANIGEDRPYSIVSDLAQMYGAFDLVPWPTPRITWCLATIRSSCDGSHQREKDWRVWRFVSPEAGRPDWS